MNTTSIKFFWNGIKVNGEKKLIRCFYSLDNNVDGRPNVTIYARDCERLPRDVFVVHNDTDLYTDYFDDDSAELTPEHPLYKYARAAALKAAMRGEPEYIAKLRAGLGQPGGFCYDSRKAEIERREQRLAQYTAELAELPQTQPTSGDLAAVEAMNTAAESARIAAEQAEQQARRERELNRRVEGRRLIAEVTAEHPLDHNAPWVEIPFSEHPAFCDYDADAPLGLSVTAAEIILGRLDEQRIADNEAEGGGGYDKTDFIVHYVKDGEAGTYEGRYDIGDGDGGLIEHIRSFGRMYAERGRFGNGNVSDEDKAKGREILELADWLDCFNAQSQNSSGQIIHVEFAPWFAEAVKQRQEQQRRDMQDIFDAVEMLTDDQLEEAVMSIEPTDEKRLDVARFFLQKLMTRDRARALEVFRRWQGAAG